MKKLELTRKEMDALISCIDTLSSLSDGLDDDGITKKEIKTVDKMLNKNGIKRRFS